MKFGFCADIDFGLIEAVKTAGFDYVELPLNALSEYADFDKLEKFLAQLQLPCCSCNLFFPPGLKLVGAERDLTAVDEYLTRMIPKVKRLGVEVLVFGNGGARRTPEGATPAQTLAQLHDIVELMETHAAKNNIKIAVEPLNSTETDNITSFAQALKITDGLQNVAAMIDSYHVLMDEQDYADVIANPARLLHVHTAYSRKRYVPAVGDDKSGFAPLVTALRKIGYNGKMSIEGHFRPGADAEPQASLASALTFLKELF
jgi:sugar phosphate isomerase/epimerase